MSRGAPPLTCREGRPCGQLAEVVVLDLWVEEQGGLVGGEAEAQVLWDLHPRDRVEEVEVLGRDGVVGDLGEVQGGVDQLPGVGYPCRLAHATAFHRDGRT